MNELILIAHIFIGILSVVFSFGEHSKNERFLKVSEKLQPSSVVLVGVSGIGLMLTGSSLTRTCISGAVFMVAVYMVKRLAGATSPIKTRANQ